MLSGFVSVGRQVVILFIIIGVGFVCTKKKVFTADAMSCLSKFVLYIVTPCVILESFNRPFDSAMLKGLGLSALCSCGIHSFCILLAHLLMHDKDEGRLRVLRVGTVFSNCGFMALPLQEALIGSDGVFYGAAYIAMFNLFSWTYGFFQMAGGKEKFSPGKVLLNPGVLSVFIGLFLFLTPLQIPSIIFAPIQNLADMNMPVPMIIIGYYLANITSFKVLKDAKLVLSLFLRLIVAPLCAFGALYALGLRGGVLTAVIIAASAPSAANTVMFSVMFGRDTELATTMVALSTLFSIITMPLVVALTIGG